MFWQGVEFLILVRNRRRTGGPHMFGSDLEGSEGDFTPKRVSLEAGIGLGVGLLGGAVGLILGAYACPRSSVSYELTPGSRQGPTSSSDSSWDRWDG